MYFPFRKSTSSLPLSKSRGNAGLNFRYVLWITICRPPCETVIRKPADIKLRHPKAVFKETLSKAGGTANHRLLEQMETAAKYKTERVPLLPSAWAL